MQVRFLPGLHIHEASHQRRPSFFLRLPRLVAIEFMNQIHDGRGMCDPKRSERRYLCRHGAERHQKTQTAQHWIKQLHGWFQVYGVTIMPSEEWGGSGHCSIVVTSVGMGEREFQHRHSQKATQPLPTVPFLPIHQQQVVWHVTEIVLHLVVVSMVSFKQLPINHIGER